MSTCPAWCVSAHTDTGPNERKMRVEVTLPEMWIMYFLLAAGIDPAAEVYGNCLARQVFSAAASLDVIEDFP